MLVLFLDYDVLPSNGSWSGALDLQRGDQSHSNLLKDARLRALPTSQENHGRGDMVPVKRGGVQFICTLTAFLRVPSDLPCPDIII